MTGTTGPAGWYAQPDGNERFWTGTVWSDQVRPHQSSAVVPAQPAQVAGLQTPQLAYTQQGYVAVTQVAPKSPGLALLGSFFFPGLGQLINGQVGKGIAMFAAYLVSLVLLFAFIGFFLVPAIWIWSMVDAYGGAKQWNARHGILS
jgi:TM2 domain-containing membrane protein YozV